MATHQPGKEHAGNCTNKDGKKCVKLGQKKHLAKRKDKGDTYG